MVPDLSHSMPIYVACYAVRLTMCVESNISSSLSSGAFYVLYNSAHRQQPEVSCCRHENRQASQMGGPGENTTTDRQKYSREGSQRLENRQCRSYNVVSARWHAVDNSVRRQCVRSYTQAAEVWILCARQRDWSECNHRHASKDS